MTDIFANGSDVMKIFDGANGCYEFDYGGNGNGFEDIKKLVEQLLN